MKLIIGKLHAYRVGLSRICIFVFGICFLSTLVVNYLDKLVFQKSKISPVGQVFFIILAVAFLAGGLGCLVQDKNAFITKRPAGIFTQRMLGLAFVILAIVALCNTGRAEGNASIWLGAISHYFATGQIVR